MYDIFTKEAPSLIQQLFPKAGMCMVTAQDQPLEETITLNLQDLKFKKKTRFRVPLLCLEQFTSIKLRHVNKNRSKNELRVSLLNNLESENELFEYIGVSELITSLPEVKFTVLFSTR